MNGLLPQQAMRFAMETHKDQKRKYTHEPYWKHLAEVAGIVANTYPAYDTPVIIAWLHDCMEDQGVTDTELTDTFGPVVALGVRMLSDMEQGNRATRKQLSRERLAAAPDWIQTIKCADLISNTSSIVQHDPNFAKVYLEEKRLLLDVMTSADPDLRQLSYSML